MSHLLHSYSTNKYVDMKYWFAVSTLTMQDKNIVIYKTIGI